jgi:general secretion pathway protein D
MDVGLNHSWNLGVSVAQNPKNLKPSVPIVAGCGMNNGQTFSDFLNGSLNLSTNSSSTFANSLPGGLSYFGNIGPSWDVALQAAAADSTVSVIQRPRIQTSQAKAAAFFVGQTVPYVTGSTYGSAYGNSASYSQLSVGVELNVTPFINPDGLVVMDIQQEIDDLNGTTHIDNVGDVPNTTKRTLSSEIAVRDRDTIILGGFVRSDKSKSKSGVPLLMDIPILGNLFTSRTDKKDRSETIVLIRPTVLKTPEIAAAQAVKEQNRLPGIAHAAAEDAESERKQVEAERRAELRRAKARGYKDDRFNPLAPNTPVDTNGVSSPNP